VLSVSLWVFGLIWGYLIHDGFAATELSHSQAYWLDVLRKLLLLEVVLGLLTMFEWHFAYTIYWNFLVNESVEALCEWTLVGVALFSPVVLANLLPDLKFTLHMSPPKKGQEL
jgi:hypothetical protein